MQIKPLKLVLPNADIWYFERYFPPSESHDYFHHLQKEIFWEEAEIKVYGKIHKQPRLSAWYGDRGLPYTYSGTTFLAKPWTQSLLEIKKAVEKEAATSFNSVLLNLYRDGKDSMGLHSDDEQELGKEPIIASVSFGASRLFRFKSKQDPTPGADIELKDGSLLLMKGKTQQYWKHAIPKSSKVTSPRINLTFRTILRH